jgi:uncharacterized membrane protein YjjP (DUF1212 family)
VKALSLEELRDILSLSLRAGQLMLENGANTNRSEEAVEQLGLALGAERIDVFATPTGIIATDMAGMEHRTKIVRIFHTGMDLSRVAEVSALARRAATDRLDRDTVRAALESIASRPRLYPPRMTVLAAALACGSFCVLMGGGLREALVTVLAAAGAQTLRERIGGIPVGRLLQSLCVTALAAGLAMVASALIRPAAPEVALLASVLLLVPGALMISSASDLFRGDMVSGMARATLASLVVATIGAGIWMILLVTGAKVAMIPRPPPSLPLAVVFAFTATAGYALLFQAPRAVVPICALLGSVAYAARVLLLRADLVPEAAIFLSGATIALLAEPFARGLKLPQSVFTVPGFIPLVPGASAFRTVLAFVSADYVSGTANLVLTLLLVGMLAAGLGTVSAALRVSQVPHRRDTTH